MTSPFDNYLGAWLQNISGVLQQLATETLIVEQSGADPGAMFASLENRGVWLRFSLGKRLRGQQAFLVSESDGVRLGRMLMGEQGGEAETLTADYRDALEEVFRQFAGPTAAALTKADGDTSISWEGVGCPPWKAAKQVLVRVSASAGPPIMIGMAMDETLATVLIPKAKPGPAFSTGDEDENAPTAPSAGDGARVDAVAQRQHAPRLSSTIETLLSGPGERNLDLLLEVPLQVTLRFGERQLLLRDVLDLSPGSVVELDRQVKEPAELLVTGRVVARGEVVIVDGNYGLRITEVAPPAVRAEILQ